ncbi:MAG: hypothetical protein ACXW4H_05890, partial [Candidatus Limnocylindrales bacterium]
QPGWTSRGDPNRRRREIRYLAAAASAATALLYFGIGAGVLKVVDKATPDAPDLATFGAAAGAAFVLGAILLLALDQRGVWLLGAIFQAVVIVMYVAVSTDRTPPFEQWGTLIKVLQAAILAALTYLVVRQPVRRTDQVLRSI